MKKIVFSLLVLLASLAVRAQKNQVYLLAGTYTSPGASEGIYVYSFDQSTGVSTPVSSVPSTNPSYLAVSPDEKFVYAVNETKNGQVSSFSFDKASGKLSLLNVQSSNGDDPCYVSTDKTGKWVAVGNYSSGTLALYPVQKDGSLGKAVQVIRHEGSGVNTDRQEGPHVHSTVFSPDNKYLFVADLGTDKEMIYSFDSKKGKLKPAKMPFIQTEPGSGPRHFIFHPQMNRAYLIQELSGTISVYQYAKGTLALLQDISSQPLDYLGEAAGADIHVSPDGKYLYASNRATSNTIGIYQVKADGTLQLYDHQSTLGKTPRNFNFDPSGNFLLAANQNSNDIVVFKVDKSTGALTDSGQRIKISKPVCVKWVGMK